MIVNYDVILWRKKDIFMVCSEVKCYILMERKLVIFGKLYLYLYLGLEKLFLGICFKYLKCYIYKVIFYSSMCKSKILVMI